MLVAAAPVQSPAAAPTTPTGLQLLQAQLPSGTAVPQASCDQLARAVSLATSAHHNDAPAILTAALMRTTKGDARTAPAKLPCASVARLLRASVTAAPDKASALLEVADSLYPDCADTLQAALEAYNDKNVVDGKDRPGAAPAGARNAANDPGADGARDASSNNFDPFDPLSAASGFGVGFGPGFPGSPGFTGSPASGAIALPPNIPVVTPDTAG